jgi:hypothetical protein
VKHLNIPVPKTDPASQLTSNSRDPADRQTMRVAVTPLQLASAGPKSSTTPSAQPSEDWGIDRKKSSANTPQSLPFIRTLPIHLRFAATILIDRSTRSDGDGSDSRPRSAAGALEDEDLMQHQARRSTSLFHWRRLGGQAFDGRKPVRLAISDFKCVST